MRKLNENTKKELSSTYGNILTRIGENSLSDSELDELLLILLKTFKDIDNVEIYSDNVNISALEKNLIAARSNKVKGREGKKILELVKTLSSSKIFKISEEDKAIEERLYRHFEENFVKESKSKEVDIDFEVKTKYQMTGKNLYFEQQIVLLTMMNSFISTQEEINNIKILIEKDFSFTSSIKRVIKDKSKFPRIKELCKLQDIRFKENEEARNRLY